MKQILQNLRSGTTEVTDVPAPLCRRGHLKIRTISTLISAGTERMLVEFSQGNLLQKARSQPDKVKQVLDKVRTEGLLPTLENVFKRLDEPLPLGYCNVGEVIEIGALENDNSRQALENQATGQVPLPHSPARASHFKIGDRVASNGPHAEIVCVPAHLCAKVPANVPPDQAAFTVLGSIGLQGIRLLKPELGEKIVVFGTGLIGLMTVQLLRAAGCQVLAIDCQAERLQMATGFGARTCDFTQSDPVSAARAWTEGEGVDGVLITASAKTDDIVHQAAEMCRKRGRIILVGVVGLNLHRSDFYEKELTFQVSCSYGPGRYDDNYELKGQDYPAGFVRWTEQRNFQAVLQTMATGQLDVAPLITNRFLLQEASSAYQLVQQSQHALGVLLQYPNGKIESEKEKEKEKEKGKDTYQIIFNKSHQPSAAGSNGDRHHPPLRTRPPFNPFQNNIDFRPLTIMPQIPASLIDENWLLEAGETNSDMNGITQPSPPPQPSSIFQPVQQSPFISEDQGVAEESASVFSLSPSSSPSPSFAATTALPLAKNPVLAILGAGNFAKMTLAPGLAKYKNARLKYVADLANGPAAAHLARKYGFEQAVSDSREVFADPEVNAVFIATGHSSHATLACQALAANKHVMVEKPLAMNITELKEILKTANNGISQNSQPLTSPRQSSLSFGFNRRFSPYTVKIKQLLTGRAEPLDMHFACNAGTIPPEVWVHDPQRGGGRIIGEACHFIDLLAFIADSPVVSVAATQMNGGVAVQEDKMAVMLAFADGSMGTINYYGNGHKAYPKETLEIYSEGRILKLDNFRRLDGWGFRRFRKMKGRIDKGHADQFRQFIERVASSGQPLIPLEELANTTLASFAAMTAARENRMVLLNQEYTL